MIELKPLSSKVKASVSIPGSKSYTNRALLMSSLVKGPVWIGNPLFSDDTLAMINCLKKLGIEIEVSENGILVKGSIDDIGERDYDLDCEISGTTIRFLLALCCVVPGVKTLYGKKGLNKRPIGELVNGLRQLGAKIQYLEKQGFPPLLIKSSNLNSGITKLDGDISSQYFSALLMISPLINGLVVRVVGNQISKPYIDMTIDTMKLFGVHVENRDYREYEVLPEQRYGISAYTVEGDFSSAGYFFAIATLTNSEIILENLNPYSRQADRRFLDVLKKMGTQFEFKDLKIIVKGNGVKPIEVDMEDCPDQVQTLAVLASFAKGETIITGVRSLRMKETERVRALEKELAKMEIKTQSTKNRLVIYGGDPKGAIINTYGDHRMAMSFAVAGAKLAGMKINNPEVVSKTFPDFWKKLEEIGIELIND